MKTKLLNNLLLKLLSVAAAMVLWLIVVNIDDPITDVSFRNIKVDIVNADILADQGQVYRVVEGTDTVDLTVYARTSVAGRLQASDFRATADVQKDLRYDSMVSISVSYVGGNARTEDAIERIDQSRSNVLVSIEESVTEQFKVTTRYTNEPSDGLEVGTLTPKQTVVEITGPKSTVDEIREVVAEVNIAGITGTAVRTCTLKLIDGNGDEMDDTYLEYAEKDQPFQVTVTTLNTKEVGISFDVSQAAPEGYGLSAISYTPQTVTIAGEQSNIRPILNLDIPAEALNPDGQTGSVEQTVDISQYLPDGIRIPDENEREIVVRMEIVPYETTSYTFVPGQIHFANIQEGLELDAEDSGDVTIQVSGLPADLAALTQDSIQLTADLADCTRAGSYTVPVTVTIPDGYTCSDTPEITVRLVRTEE